MTKFLKIISISLSFILSINALIAQEEIDGVAAVIEDHIVLKSTVEGQYQQALASGEFLPIDAKCQILDQLLLEKLFLAEAERDSIYIGEDDVNNELDRRMGVFVQMFGTQEKLEEYYNKSVFELKEEFRSDVRQQMLSERMKGKIYSNLNISPNEVKTFYDEIPKDSLPFFNAEVQIGQIVVMSKPTLSQKQEAKEKAQMIRNEIIDGTDFAFQALLYSDDPGSSNNGGDLGWVKRGVFVPDFEAVAFRLKENEVSEVVETEYGYHIIQLLEKKGNRIKARHVLISPKTDISNKITAEKDIIAIKEKLEKGKLNFQEAVRLHSEDQQSKMNGGLLTNQETGNTFFEMNKLEADIALALDNKSPGQFTEVMPYVDRTGNAGFKIVYLKTETPAHQASIETDYSKIKAVAKQTKQQEVLIKWIEKKSKTVFVRLNASYSDCDVLEKWKTNSASR